MMTNLQYSIKIFIPIFPINIFLKKKDFLTVSSISYWVLRITFLTQKWMGVLSNFYRIVMESVCSSHRYMMTNLQCTITIFIPIFPMNIFLKKERFFDREQHFIRGLKNHFAQVTVSCWCHC